MQHVFPRIFNALRLTLEYYKWEKIPDNIMRMSGTGWQSANPKIFLQWYDTVLSMHQSMEDEILQTVNTSNHITLVIMFEYLKGWLNNYLIKDGANESVIAYEVEEYNKEIYKDFLERTANKESEFHSKRDLSKKHLEECETPNLKSLERNFRLVSTGKTTLTNYIYYCIEEVPALLDTLYINEYTEWVDRLINNLKYKIERHVRLYDEGKYLSFDTIKLAKTEIAATQIQKSPLLENPTQNNKRLKVNLSVEQLTFLFRLLKDGKIIESKFDKDIHEFLADNFETVARENTKISSKNMGKLWSSKDIELINFWIGKFTDLTKIAGKK